MTIFALHTAGVSSLVGKINFITSTLCSKKKNAFEHLAIFL